MRAPSVWKFFSFPSGLIAPFGKHTATNDGEMAVAAASVTATSITTTTTATLTIPVALNMAEHLTHAFTFAPQLTLTAAAYPLAAYNRQDQHSHVRRDNTCATLELPPHRAYGFIVGVPARDWDAALVNLVKQQWPTLSDRKIRDRVRPMCFHNLAVSTLEKLVRNPHIFGAAEHQQPLVNRLFPHYRQTTDAGSSGGGDGDRMTWKRPKDALTSDNVKFNEALKQHLSGQCLIPFHMLYFFWWLAHTTHVIPVEQLLLMRDQVQRQVQRLFQQLGNNESVGVMLTESNDVVAPDLAALVIVPIKLDHVLMLLNRWQHGERLRAHLDNQQALDAMARVVNKLVEKNSGGGGEIAPGDLSVVRALASTERPTVKLTGGTRNKKRKRNNKNDDGDNDPAMTSQSSSSSSENSNDSSGGGSSSSNGASVTSESDSQMSTAPPSLHTSTGGDDNANDAVDIMMMMMMPALPAPLPLPQPPHSPCSSNSRSHAAFFGPPAAKRRATEKENYDDGVDAFWANALGL